MSTVNNGGPAFPTSRINMAGEVVPDEEGMSLRDYFAAKALPACIAAALKTSLDELQISELAYNFADAMLKAREEKP